MTKNRDQQPISRLLQTLFFSFSGLCRTHGNTDHSWLTNAATHLQFDNVLKPARCRLTLSELWQQNNETATRRVGKKLSVWEQSPAALHRSWTNCHLSVTVNITAAGVIRCCISTAEALGVTIYCIRLNNDQPQLFLAAPFWAACNKKQTDLYNARNFRVLSTTMHTKKTIVTSQDRQRKTIQRTFQHFYQIGIQILRQAHTHTHRHAHPILHTRYRGRVKIWWRSDL